MEARTLGIIACDLFCGGGGSSTGLTQAAAELGRPVELLAINCDPDAIATHALNHPGVRHLCQRIETVVPQEAVPGGKLDLLLASPECTHFSTARGGKPMSDQKRSSPWRVLEWLNALDVAAVIIENVPEFTSWGPLHPEGHANENRPIEKSKGAYFRNFIRNLRTLGYRVDWRVLNAADYGAATTRKRLFVLCRKGRKAPAWPEPTHARPMAENRTSQPSLGITTPRLPWRPAREIIDWTVPGESIYTRARPLAPNTLARIYAGLRKFSGVPFLLPHQHGNDTLENVRGLDGPLPSVTATSADMFLAHPFLVVLQNNRDSRSLEEPLPSVLCSGAHFGLAEPFIVPQFSQNGPRSVESPLGTLTTTSRGVGLAEPFIMVNRSHGSGPGGCSHGLGEPVRSLTTGENMALIEPYLLGQQSCAAPRSVGQPVPTVAGAGAISLIEPFLVGAGGPVGAGAPHSTGEPLGTVLSRDHRALVEPFLCAYRGNHAGQADGALRVAAVDEPLRTLDTSNRYGLCRPYLVRYNGTGDAEDLDAPLPAVTTRDRFALVHPELVRSGAVAGPVVGYLDIRFRMLQPHELAAAMSFPKTYVFVGSREKRVRQIGNAVDVKTARALCRALLGAPA